MAVSEVAADLFGLTKRQVDRLVPVETREKAYAQTQDFALARPLLFVCNCPFLLKVAIARH
jgi:hypothetical protein